MSYKNLEIWQLALELIIDIDIMTFTELPKHAMFEEGKKLNMFIQTVTKNHMSEK